MLSSVAVLCIALLFGRSKAQYTDGGVVELSCEECYCEGVGTDGDDEVDFRVLDLVSSGQRVSGYSLNVVEWSTYPDTEKGSVFSLCEALVVSRITCDS